MRRTSAIAAALLIAAAAPAQETKPASRPAPAAGMIAFTRGGNVWVIEADGRNERQLTRDLAYDRPLRWTPDGRAIIYWKHPEDWHLWTVEAESRAQRDLTPDGGDCRSPAPSPDGRLLAFMSGRDGVSLANADGTGRRSLSKLGHRDAPPSWSPDGSKLAFVDLRLVGEQHVDTDVWLWSKDGGGEPVKLATSAEEPGWSRDGRTLYCTARRRARSDLVAIDLATRAERNLTSTPDLNESLPAVSPDGRTIAMVAWDAQWESAELRIVDADGSNPRMLVKLEGRPDLPSWSPDSARIAITMGPRDGPNLFVVEIVSGHSTQLTREGASWAAWRPGR